jgi:hypothetical protein
LASPVLSIKETTMSTRCQIGFYDTADQPLPAPTALIYRHSDGYPDTEVGVLAALLPWAQDFHARRGLGDAEYAAARALVALIRAADALDEVTGYGLCGDHQLHGDTAYYYRVDPSGITVYDAGDNAWASLERLAKHPVSPEP